MKKFLLATLSLLMVVSVLVAASVNNVALADTAEAEYKTTEEYEFLKDFLSNCPNRYRAEEEKKAAEYLKTKFDELLGQVDGAEEAAIKTYGSEQSEIWHNVVAGLKVAGSNEQIIIGAHFDAVGDGANDNASGVTALYFTMRKLVEHYEELPCNVVFVAFGGEERGLLGSSQYVSDMSAAERQNTLLMINIDSISNGDNLYLFCENKKTSIANLFLQNDASKTIAEKPYAHGTYNTDMYGYGYYETIQGSDYTPFRLAEVPTAFFFSGNFVAWNYVESTDADKNTMNTNADTLENLNRNGAQVVERIQNVTSAIVDTVLSNDFYDVASNARSELMNNNLLFNEWWPRLIGLGVLIVLAVLAFIYYRKLQKKSILGTAEIKQNTVFNNPQADDIFSFESKKNASNADKNNNQSNGSGGDIDDIFTFKK